MDSDAFILQDQGQSVFFCKGAWVLKNSSTIAKQLKKSKLASHGEAVINGADITQLDSAGSLLLVRMMTQAESQGLVIKLDQFSEQHTKLISIIKRDRVPASSIPVPVLPSRLAMIGGATVHFLDEFVSYLQFIGSLTYEWLRIVHRSRSWRWNEVAAVIFKTGLQALPIIALLSYMIGVVISYQMGNQLRAYGANIFIVNLLGLSILREFGPLITAIMVAGRTGSAFTAQLGIMKINQEIDALNTMGITPAELLILPRLLGLLIALPLLTMWANAFGIIGGMMMAKNMLDIGWYDFLMRFQHEIPLRALLIGLGKTPIFALIIASVGCFEGMRVRGSADSVGTQTTRSVVLAIFFIIVADAIFSVIFSRLNL